jgi:hypothetical protein
MSSPTATAWFGDEAKQVLHAWKARSEFPDDTVLSALMMLSPVWALKHMLTVIGSSILLLPSDCYKSSKLAKYSPTNGSLLSAYSSLMCNRPPLCIMLTMSGCRGFNAPLENRLLAEQRATRWMSRYPLETNYSRYLLE